MLNTKTRNIIERSRNRGWVLEPEAKELLSSWNFSLPGFIWTSSLSKVEAFAEEQGYPLVMKIVSSQIVHKTESKGVVLGIDSLELLRETFHRFSEYQGFEGVLVEEMIPGTTELIIGSKTDFQFGPVVLLGIGGTGVEIYQDTVLRMAPLTEADVGFMFDDLKGKALLSGFRGGAGINFAYLTQMLIRFSNLVMDLKDIESIDLNPVICTRERAVIADARIILKQN
ncbi:MAG: acetate--CoA ligase family protein [Desulfohalobiaceae bacterium]|nr:acetate--CoA ligase family protein [Desulfohalobiaceae bacterium]